MSLVYGILCVSVSLALAASFSVLACRCRSDDAFVGHALSVLFWLMFLSGAAQVCVAVQGGAK